MTSRRQLSAAGWLTVEELATHLAVSRRLVYQLVRDRRVPFRRLPGSGVVRFAPEDVAAIEHASAQPAEGPTQGG